MLMKATAKRPRTRVEIQQNKRQAEEQKLEVEAKFQQMAEMEQRMA